MIALAGLALLVPVVAVDLTFFGPSHGGWIALDFRGLLIGAYVIAVGTELALSSLALALFARRDAAVVLAHGLALVVMASACGLYWFVEERRDEAAYEEAERIYEAARRAAPDEVAIVRWRRLQDTEPAAIELTVRAAVSGRFSAGYVQQAVTYVYLSESATLSAGQEVTLTLSVDRDVERDLEGAADRGDYVHAAWTSDGPRIPMRFCRPACGDDGLDDSVVLALPDPDPASDAPGAAELPDVAPP